VSASSCAAGSSSTSRSNRTDAAARADGAGGRATWHTPIQHGPFDTYPPLPPLSAAVGISPWIDDFSSEAERAAFCGRPPIAAHEIAAVDLDDLARRLTDEESEPPHGRRPVRGEPAGRREQVGPHPTSFAKCPGGGL
jgi:hypothetical protein